MPVRVSFAHLLWLVSFLVVVRDVHSQTFCPANSASPAGSTDLSSCLCNMGYTGPNGEACLACEVGTFKKYIGSENCTTCTTNSVSSANNTVCFCNEGYQSVFHDFELKNQGGATGMPNIQTITKWIIHIRMQYVFNGGFQPLIGNRQTGFYASIGGSNSLIWAMGTTKRDYSGAQLNWYTGPTLITSSLPNLYMYTNRWYQLIVSRNENTLNFLLYDESSGSLASESIIWRSFGFLNYVWFGGGYPGSPNEKWVGGVSYFRFRADIIYDATNVTNLFLGTRTLDNKCKICEANTYSTPNRDSCLLCPALTTSLEASSAITHCTCNAGYTGPDGGPCTVCAGNKYKVFTGSGNCTDCPVSSSSLPGSTVISACKCNPGYTGLDGNPCEVCAAGTYKDVAGSGSCTTCQLNSQQAAGGAICHCNIGYNLNFSEDGINYARACGAGKNTACPAAQSNTMHNSPADLAVDGSHGTITHTGTGNGWWRVDMQQQVVVSSLSVNSGATSIGGGYVYIGDYDTDQLTRNAVCVANLAALANGVIGVIPCSTKLLGRYVYLTIPRQFLQLREVQVWGRALYETCTACVVGKYKLTVDSSACIDCPINRVFSVDKQVCHCNVGHSGPPEGVCVACDAGTYKNSTGHDACTFCPATRVSLPGSISAAACVCDVGYTGLNGGSCTVCAVGTFKTVRGSAVCTNCGAGTYKVDTGPGMCTACPAFSTSPAGSSINTSCTCNAGYTGVNGEPCTVCAVGTYKSGSDPGTCALCPNSSTSPAGSGVVTACMCNAGYTGANGGACTACAVGTFKAVIGPAVCTNCAAGTYKINVGTGICTACPTFSNSPAASTVNINCTCNAGYTGANGGACTACAVNTYKLGVDPGICASCPNSSISPAGSGVVTACVYNAGYTGANGGPCDACAVGKIKAVTGVAVCSICAVGTYMERPGASTCTSCPTFSTSPTTSTSNTACMCNAGYTGANGESCTACAAGTYKTGSDPGTCAPCPNSSTSPAGSGVVTACVCNAGYTGANGETCTVCTAGSYTVGTSRTICSVCPASSTSPVGSSAITDCSCNTGYTGANGGSCTACVSGKYKDIIGSALCVNCGGAKWPVVTSGEVINPTSIIGTSEEYLLLPYAGTQAQKSYTVNFAQDTECDILVVGGGGGGDKEIGGGGGGGAVLYARGIIIPAETYTVKVGNGGAQNTNGGASEAFGATCLGGGSTAYFAWATPNNGRQGGSGSGGSPGSGAVANAIGGGVAVSSIGNFLILYNTSTETIKLYNGMSGGSGSPQSSSAVCPGGGGGAITSGNPGPNTRLITRATWITAGRPGKGGDGVMIPITGLNYSWGAGGGGGCHDTFSGDGGIGGGGGGGQNLNAGSERGRNGDEGISAGVTPTGINGGDAGSHTGSGGGGGSWQASIGGKGGSGVVIIRYRLPTRGLTSRAASTSVDSCVCTAGFTGLGGASCSACAEGKYKSVNGSAGCATCPVGSISPMSSTDITACICDAGFTSATSNVCELCTAGKYKSVWGTAECTVCPAGAPSAAGSTSESQCGWPCDAGYTGRHSTPDEVCIPCEADTYKNTTDGAKCTRCPANSNSPAGSVSAEACLCQLGYTGLDERACQACTAGQYKDAAGSAACTDCATNNTSPLGSTSVGACVCSVGHTGINGEVCTACVAAKYKNISGSSLCTNCPANSISPMGSISAGACLCSDGYTGINGGVCTACVAGKYKNNTGSGVCTSCPSLSNSLAASTSVWACLCGAGYTRISGDVCIACVAGTYKGLIGNTPCTNCEAGKYSATIASTSDTCQACPVNKASPAGSWAITQCICSPGYTGLDAGTCTACVAGSYKNNPGSSACTMCGNHTYSTALAATSADACLACPSNSTSVAGSDNISRCFCLLGFEQTLDHAVCSECSVGYYSDIDKRYMCSKCPGGYSSVNKRSIGLESCKTCPAGTWSRNLTAICELCPTNSNSPPATTFMQICTCNAGATGPDGQTCVLCTPGKYKVNNGSAECESCSAGTYSEAVGATFFSTCRACPSNSQSPEGSSAITACMCNAGYTSADGGDCTACVAGKYSTTAASTCTTCPASSTSPAGSSLVSDCTCNAGYTGLNGDLCTACSEGTYKSTVGSVSCTLCTENAFSHTGMTWVGACGCKSGYGATGGYETLLCTACLPGTYKPNIYNNACSACPTGSSSALASTSLSDCVCKENYSGPNGGPCLCSAGYYDRGACDACPVGTYKPNVGDRSTGAVCVDRLDENGNTWLDPDGNDCQGVYSLYQSYCGYGDSVQYCCGCQGQLGSEYIGFESYTGDTTYATSVWAQSACAACPANSASLSGSSALINCLCNAGYTGPNGGPCLACVAGSYKSSSGSSSCTMCDNHTYATALAATSPGVCLTCPSNSTSVAGSDNINRCFCILGFEQTLDHTACAECTSGYYDDENSRYACSKCPGGYSLLNRRSIGVESCKSCPAGTWSHNLTAFCELCPSNSNSPATSAYITNCTCNAGTTGPDGETCVACVAGKYTATPGSMTCIPCEAGKYSALAGSASCTTCPALSTSPEGSSVDSACTCNAGYTSFSASVGTNYARACGTYGNQPCPAGQSSTCWNGDPGRAVDGNANANFNGSSCTHTCDWNTNSYWVLDMQQEVRVERLTARGRQDERTSFTQGYTIYIGNYDSSSYTLNAVCVANQPYLPQFSALEITCLQPLAGRYIFFAIPGAALTLCELQVWGVLACAACFPGTYKATVGSDCTSCSPGTYADSQAATVCTTCQLTSSSLAGSTAVSACTCNAGYTDAVSFAVSASTNYARACGALGNEACPADQTSTGFGGDPGRAVDGNANPIFSGGSCTHTAPGNPNAFWFVDMQREILVTRLSIRGRQEDRVGWTEGYTIYIGNYDRYSYTLNAVCVANQPHLPQYSAIEIACPQLVGRYVFFAIPGSNLTLCELQVWGKLPCAACVAGKYKDVAGNTSCSDCPPASGSPVGSVSPSACVCVAGHTGLPPVPGTNYARACGATRNTACPAYQNSEGYGGNANRAVDGNDYPIYSGGSCTHTSRFDNNPVWWLDMQQEVRVERLTIRGRQEDAWGYSEGYSIYIGNYDSGSWTQNAVCVARQPHFPQYSAVVITCPTPLVGRYVFIANTQPWLTMCEVWVWGINFHCSACPVGTYKAANGSAACTSCPLGESTLGGSNSTSISACVCGTGYTGPDDGLCSECVIGKYKAIPGSAACIDCPAGKYAASVNASVCVDCPANSHAPGASDERTDCICNAGATGASGGPCTLCVAGTYKASNGSHACAVCPVGTYSLREGVTNVSRCWGCPAGSNSSVGSNSPSACVCRAGYTGRSPDPATNYARACGALKNEACPAWQPSTCWNGHAPRAVDGYDWSNYNSQSCTHTCDWSTNSYWALDMQQEVRVERLTVRGRQEERSDWTRGYTIYIGNSGSNSQNAVCVADQSHLPQFSSLEITCPQPLVGRFLFFVIPGGGLTLCELQVWGVNSPCSACSGGTYKSANGSAECLACPTWSNSPAGSNISSACACNAGYTGLNGESCTACVAGKYKSVTGSATCTDCIAGKYSTSSGMTTETTCVTCVAGKYSATLGASADTACIECDAGKYSETVGANHASACIDCSIGTYSTENGATSALTCVSCPANSA